ncbi:MAG: hypothetical protein WA728_30575, partial [Xanthobacteraceae bacterium]
MTLRFTGLVLIAAMVASLGQGLAQSPAPGAGQGAGQSWPPLPTTGFVSGRAATDKDVADGNAVFALRA